MPMLTRGRKPETQRAQRRIRRYRQPLGAAALAAIAAVFVVYAAATPAGGSIERTNAVLAALSSAAPGPALASAAQTDAPAASAVGLGFSMLALTPEVRRRYAVDRDQVGVLVTGVRQNTQASESGFRPGDVIVEVNGKAVQKPAEVSNLLTEVASGDHGSARFLISRKGDARVLILSLRGY